MCEFWRRYHHYQRHAEILAEKGENGSYSFDESVVKPVVIGWSEKYNTYGKARDFQTSGGATVHLTGGDYGWRVWQDKTTEALMAALNEGKSQELEATWLYKGQTHGGNDIDEPMWKFLSVSSVCGLQRPCIPGRYSCSNRKSKQKKRNPGRKCLEG